MSRIWCKKKENEEGEGANVLSSNPLESNYSTLRVFWQFARLNVPGCQQLMFVAGNILLNPLFAQQAAEG